MWMKMRTMAVIGAGLAVMPWLAAQAPEQKPGNAEVMGEPVPATVPLEDQATKEQLARLFDVMRLRQQMESITKVMPAMMQRQIEVQSKEFETKLPDGTTPTADQKAAIEKIVKKYMEKALQVYPVEAMIEDLTTVYQKHLSKSDVEAFIAFYNSTPGQHLLDQQPAIMKEFMPIAMQRTQEHSKQLNDELKREIEVLSKSAGTADGGAQK